MRNNKLEIVCNKLGMELSKIEQKSEEWKYLRAGLITASEFSNILPLKSGKYGVGRQTYMNKLITEISDRSSGEEVFGKAIEWGNTYEPVARAKYALYLGHEIKEVPFFIAENERLGCSPDGLSVGGDIGFEIKCPFNAIHHTNFATGVTKDEYFHQANFSMYLTGAQKWHLVSYNPRCTVAGKDLIVMEFLPNKELFDFYDLHINSFLDEMNEKLMEIYGIDFSHKYFNFKKGE